MNETHAVSGASLTAPGAVGVRAVGNLPGKARAQMTDVKDAKILIVDDTPANLDLLRNVLKPLGAHIFFATSGASALEVAKNARPDLILMDVMMPDMDGFETCRRLKATEDLAEIPVIFATAKTEVQDIVTGFEAGGVDYITKPLKQPEVQARVTSQLKIQSLIRQQQESLAALELARKDLQELNATKDKFLSSIGRALRDSLAEISAASRALKQHADEDRLPKNDFDQRLEAVNHSAETVLGLLENVLEWPRIQAGQKLDLLDTKVGDRDLGYLIEALDDLRFLSLAGTRITNAGLEHIQAIRGLRELHLDGTSITDEGLGLISGLKELEVLDLKDTAITDAGLAYLEPLRKLRGLYLTRTAITDAGLAYVAGLKELRTLILWDTQVSDEGLPHLRALGNLQELILWGSQVTERGAAELRKAVPDCDISLSLFS